MLRSYSLCNNNAKKGVDKCWQNVGKDLKLFFIAEFRQSLPMIDIFSRSSAEDLRPLRREFPQLVGTSWANIEELLD